MIKLKSIINNDNVEYGIYHKGDMDGICSGAILKFKYPNINLIPFDYGFKNPKDIIKSGAKTLMVDVSMLMDDMYKLALHCKGNFIWVDHHQSANNDYKNYKKKIPMLVIFDDYMAACQGLWRYLYPNKKEPEIVTLVGNYDMWNTSDLDYWNNYILPFQYGIRGKNVKNFPFEAFTNNNLTQELIEKGKEVLSKVYSDNDEILKNKFEMNYFNYKALVVQILPGKMYQSNLFDKVENVNEYDVLIAFSKLKTGEWKFHFRTKKDNIDCAKLSKFINPIGGGGHLKAAGATTSDINKFLKLVPKQYLNKISI